jgi:predicted PurR-regulated permease PerM
MLVVIALFGALYAARGVMLPIALAFVLSFLLAPVIRLLQKLHIPPAIGSAFVLLALMSFAGGVIGALAAPAAAWIERAPQAATRIQERLETVRQQLHRFTRATETVEEFATGNANGQDRPVKIRGPGLKGYILSLTWQIVGSAAVMLFLLYFLLASGDLFLRKLVRTLRSFHDKRIAVTVALTIQHDISRYLFTVTLINAGLAVVVTAVMYFLELPNPALWGVMAGVLNYIPYLGPAVTLTVLTAVSLLTFDDFATAMMRPLIFLTITTFEGQLLTPYILGRRLTLNPVVVFISLIFWGWMWGIVGALLAVPLTMIIKIICDAVPPLARAGDFLSR